MSLVGVRWVRESKEPGRVTSRVGYKAGRVVAEWEGIGVVSATPSGADVEIVPVAGLDPTYEEKWRRGLVRGLLRHLEGRTTLHGSAVAIDGHALVFLGESGAGKSTCAADLCARLDGSLLADDTVELERDGHGHRVSASERAHWLLRDSAEALGHLAAARWKQPVVAARAATGTAPLAAVVALAFAPGAPRLVPLLGVAAFTTLNESYIRFLFDDPRVTARDVDAIADIVDAVPVLTLTRPFSLKAEAMDATAALLGDFLRRRPTPPAPHEAPR